MRQPARFPLALGLGFGAMLLGYATLAATGYWYWVRLLGWERLGRPPRCHPGYVRRAAGPRGWRPHAAIPSQPSCPNSYPPYLPQGDAASPLVASDLADASAYTGRRLPLHRVLAALVLLNSLTKVSGRRVLRCRAWPRPADVLCSPAPALPCGACAGPDAPRPPHPLDPSSAPHAKQVPGLLLVLVDMILSLLPLGAIGLHPPTSVHALRLALFTAGTLVRRLAELGGMVAAPQPALPGLQRGRRRRVAPAHMAPLRTSPAPTPLHHSWR